MGVNIFYIKLLDCQCKKIEGLSAAVIDGAAVAPNQASGTVVQAPTAVTNPASSQATLNFIDTATTEGMIKAAEADLESSGGTEPALLQRIAELKQKHNGLQQMSRDPNGVRQLTPAAVESGELIPIETERPAVKLLDLQSQVGQPSLSTETPVLRFNDVELNGQGDTTAPPQNTREKFVFEPDPEPEPATQPDPVAQPDPSGSSDAELYAQ